MNQAEIEREIAAASQFQKYAYKSDPAPLSASEPHGDSGIALAAQEMGA